MKTYRTLYNTTTPVNIQIQLDPTRTSMSKTDPEGIIEYANEAFMDVCGFTRAELMGRPHSIVRHPDMPSVVFKLMWERLSRGEGIYAVVKNMTKDGKHYWVIAKINSKFDEEGNTIAHYARRKAAPAGVVARIEGFYKTLKAIEDDQNAEVAEKYFYGLLEDKELSYDEFLISIIGNEQVSIDSFFANLTARHQSAKQKMQEQLDEQELQSLKSGSTKSKRPIPIDKEIKIDPAKTIMTKTDTEGVIEYANAYFMKVSGYKEYELIGQPHNIIRHPDMPKVIFKLMWERLHKGENIYALVKNLAKDGRFYWVLTSFETKYNDNGEIISHYARRKAAPGNAVFQIEKLYKTLKAIEDKQSPDTAEKYFYGLLEEKDIDYDTFILKILETSQSNLDNYFGFQQENKIIKNKKSGLLKRMFN